MTEAPPRDMSVMAASHETILQLPVEETVKQSMTGVTHPQSDVCNSQFFISQHGLYSNAGPFSDHQWNLAEGPVINGSTEA